MQTSAAPVRLGSVKVPSAALATSGTAAALTPGALCWTNLISAPVTGLPDSSTTEPVAALRVDAILKRKIPAVKANRFWQHPGGMTVSPLPQGSALGRRYHESPPEVEISQIILKVKQNAQNASVLSGMCGCGTCLYRLACSEIGTPCENAATAAVPAPQPGR